MKFDNLSGINFDTNSDVFFFRNTIMCYKNCIISLIFAAIVICNGTRVYASVIFQKILSEVHPNAKFDLDNVTEHSFIQGRLGNCGMIAAMASLANNRELIDKVFPRNQNFNNNSLTDNKEISEFSFNLYKNGKPHKVVVDENLFFWNDSIDSNKLYYSYGREQNFLSSLLEKALVETHFEGDYGLATAVHPVKIITSFSNAFFEELYKPDLNDLGYKLGDVVTHGKRTNSLMVVGFKNELPEYHIQNYHAYTLIDCSEDAVKLYDPEGKYMTIPKNIFLENCYLFIISYIDNEIFRIPKLNTYVEFSDTWNGSDKNISYVDYDLIVEEEDTEVLVNIIEKGYNDISRLICIIPINENNTIDNRMDKWKAVSENLYKSSLRAVLGKGNYKLRFKQILYSRKISGDPQKYSEYLENDKNYFLFRFAASKQCTVKK